MIVARTDALAATLLTSDVDERDRPFITGDAHARGLLRVQRRAWSRRSRAALAYAPYADLLWCETSHAGPRRGAQFAEAVHAQFPGKMLAYNCSPSFNWEQASSTRARSRSSSASSAAMGYKFQFITLAGLAPDQPATPSSWRTPTPTEGMPAYVRVQAQEFAREADGYTATKHQREAGTATSTRC